MDVENLGGSTLIRDMTTARTKPLIAFEYFPPKTAEGVVQLYNVLENMTTKHNPRYIDFTWGAGGSTSDLTLELAVESQRRYGVDANMHLTCTNMEQEKIVRALSECKLHGVRHIVALRGDPPVGQQAWTMVEGGFACALDLVQYIRREHGDYFTISVAGYPEGHPNRITKVETGQVLSDAERGRLVHLEDGDYVCTDADFATEIAYLKEKVNAGANFIITQLFYCMDTFFAFMDACRAAGINCPIMPGIMPITTYGGFRRMTTLCKTRVPIELNSRAAEYEGKPADEALAFGVHVAIEMCAEILKRGCCPGIHIYALNKSAAVDQIVEGLRHLSLL